MILEKHIDYQGVMQAPTDSRTSARTDERAIRLVFSPRPKLLRLPGGHAGTRAPTGRHTPPPKKIFISPRPRLVLSRKPRAPRAEAAQTQVIANQPFFTSARYKILAPIGRGGMGAVYKAWDSLLNLMVAIKFVPEHMRNDPGAVERLKREAAVVMQLSHENIVKLHNLEVENGRMFLVMEYVDGENLRERLRRHGAFPLEDVTALVECCAAALSAAHSRQILHRDLKPENVMVTKDGVVKIVDFGTAFAAAERTADGFVEVEGTPSYMSPEQIGGQPLDGRTDVYSLGLLAYELLTGFSAFPLDAGMEEIVEMQMEAMTGIPEAIAAVLAKAVEKDREHRWTSVEAFASAFARAAQPYCR